MHSESGDHLDDEVSTELNREKSEVLSRVNEISESDLPRWTKRLHSDGGWKRFARRLLGARNYDLLARAIEHDISEMARGLQNLVQVVQPYAVAFDDVLKVLTPQQVRGVDSTHDWAAVSAFRFVLRLDAAISNLIDAQLKWDQLDPWRHQN